MNKEYFDLEKTPATKQIDISISSKYVYGDGHIVKTSLPYNISVMFPLYALIQIESENQKDGLIAGRVIEALSAIIENIKNGLIKF